jgi:hypothetical protein
MVWLFPERVHWWNYVLLIPAVLQSFVFLPRWHLHRYGLDVMCTKIVYAWAHLFAFTDKLCGRRLSWQATGGLTGDKSPRPRLLQVLLVGWPLAMFAAVVAGSVAHMHSPLDVNFWPPLAFAGIYTAAALLVLRPLRTTTYEHATAALPDLRQISLVPHGPPAAPVLGVA